MGWLAWIGDKIADYAVGVVMLAIATTLGVFLQRWTLGWPVAIVYACVAFGALSVGVMAVQISAARRVAARRANRTPAQIERLIRDWLWPYEFAVERKTLPGCDFAMTVADSQGPTITIGKVSKANWITFAGTMRVDIEERIAVVTKSAPSLKDDISVALIQMGLEFKVNKGPDGRSVLSVDVSQNLPFTAETTDLDVLKAIMAVRGGLKLFAAMHTRVWDEARKPPELPPPSDQNSEGTATPVSTQRDGGAVLSSRSRGSRPRRLETGPRRRG